MVKNTDIVTLGEALLLNEVPSEYGKQRLLSSRTSLSFVERIRLDNAYIEQWKRDVGEEWLRVHDTFCGFLRGKPRRGVDNLLCNARQGLIDLDKRFAELTHAELVFKPQRVYLGLVSGYIVGKSMKEVREYVLSFHTLYFADADLPASTQAQAPFPVAA